MRRMKKWTRIAAGAAVVLAVGAAICCGSASKEPVFKGRRVREYLEATSLIAWPKTAPMEAKEKFRIAHLDEPLRNPDEALRFFGTNSIPYVRAALRAKDNWNWWHRRLLWLSGKAPWLGIHVQPAILEHDMALGAYHRILQKGYWGSAGAACESEVHALTTEPYPMSMLASSVLVDIKSLRMAGQIP
jgi:hypothetical protein